MQHRRCSARPTSASILARDCSASTRIQSAAALAARRLDQVAVVDVEHDPLPFTLDRPIDCIVYGDVLEHLSDPWPVLRRHAEALSDDGSMLICVPNMQHWSFADRLLRGTWKYEPDGLLDETHLRWFSLETMREGLEAIGLVPHDVSPRVFDAAQCTGIRRHDRAGADQRSASIRQPTRSEPRRCNMSGAC